MRQAQTPKSTESGTDELVARARGRDETAIRSIMQSNNRRLYRLARGILRNDSEAEDVVQETYVRAFTHLDSFRGDSSLATWLARIALAMREHGHCLASGQVLEVQCGVGGRQPAADPPVLLVVEHQVRERLGSRRPAYSTCAHRARPSRDTHIYSSADCSARG